MKTEMVLGGAPGDRMLADMQETPLVVERLVPRLLGLRGRQAIPVRNWRRILFTSRGSSENACRIAESRFPLTSEASVSVVSPSVLAYGDLPSDMSDSLVFAVSQSGRTPEVCAAADRARMRHAFVVGMTNDPRSPLAEGAHLLIALDAGTERVIAATKTVVAQVVALLVMTEALKPAGAIPINWSLASEVIHRALTEELDYPDLRVAAVVGRGSTVGVAREGALKLMETSGVAVYGASAYDFLHGPTSILSVETSVVAIMRPGGGRSGLELLRTAIAQRDAQLVEWGRDDDLPDELEAVRLLVLLQRLAHHHAIRSGGDPDDPRGLSKITHTL